MVRDIRVKTKRMDTSAWPTSVNARPAASLFSSLISWAILESECIFNGLVGMFVKSWVEIDWFFIPYTVESRFHGLQFNKLLDIM